MSGARIMQACINKTLGFASQLETRSKDHENAAFRALIDYVVDMTCPSDEAKRRETAVAKDPQTVRDTLSDALL